MTAVIFDIASKLPFLVMHIDEDVETIQTRHADRRAAFLYAAKHKAKRTLIWYAPSMSDEPVTCVFDTAGIETRRKAKSRSGIEYLPNDPPF